MVTAIRRELRIDNPSVTDEECDELHEKLTAMLRHPTEQTIDYMLSQSTFTMRSEPKRSDPASVVWHAGFLRHKDVVYKWGQGTANFNEKRLNKPYSSILLNELIFYICSVACECKLRMLEF